MRLAAFLALASLVPQVSSAVATFTALTAGFGSTGISGDGTTVVGFLPGPVGSLPGRWRQGTGAVAYPFDPAREPRGGASSSSYDGEILAGNYEPNPVAFDDDFPYRCSSTHCVLTFSNTGFVDFQGTVFDVSSDAQYAAGYTFDDFGDNFVAVHWRPDGTFVPITPYTPEEVGFEFILSQGTAISGDGTRVAGLTWVPDDGSRHLEAFTWTTAGVFQLLGDLAGGAVQSSAAGLSNDGTTIVGSSSSGLGTEAFLWTAAGGMVPLGDLAGGAFDSRAVDASGNGSVIVGLATAAAGPTAFIWDAVHGMRSLYDVLTELGAGLAGWRLTEVTGISDDGRVLTGRGINPGGEQQSWYAVLPEPGTALLVALGLASLGVRRRR
jgi:hypothetical protein